MSDERNFDQLDSLDTNENKLDSPPSSVDSFTAPVQEEPTSVQAEYSSYEPAAQNSDNSINRAAGYTQPSNPSYYNFDNQPNPNNNYNYGYSSAPQQNQRYGYSNLPPQTPYGQEKTQKKKKSNAGLVIACIILSLVCGIAGALGGMYLYDEFIAETPDNNVSNTPTGGNSVFYESIDRELPETTTQAGTVATVAAVALPSVVEIRTEAVVNNSFYGQYVTEGAGSGVIITTDGYIVTNNHVISGASNITVRLTNGDEHKATLIGTDAQTDIAVIKIEATDLIPAVFGDSSKLVIGELTVAIGNPLGELGGTVTDGIISALDREITVEGENMILLQTNAAVSPGNSGGGLFNAKGELIGVVNAKSSGSSVEGLGFAIPINTAKTIIKDLIENGYVTGRPSIGITIIEVTSDYQRFMYNVPDYGVYIQNALNEEFKSGDRIIAIDGNSVSTSSDIKSIINGHKVGDKVTVTVSRKNKIVDVEVTLIDSAENTLTTK